MKRKIYLQLAVGYLLASTISYGVFQVSGTSLDNTPGLEGNQQAVYIASIEGDPFSDITLLDEGKSLTDSATYGSSFAPFSGISTRKVNDATVDPFLGSNVDTDTGGSPTSTGDSFGVIVFENSDIDSGTLAGDTFRIWTSDDWDIGTDGQFEFGDGLDFTTLNSNDDPIQTGTVVPEPGSYALLSGILAFGVMMYRRRRS